MVFPILIFSLVVTLIAAACFGAVVYTPAEIALSLLQSLGVSNVNPSPLSSIWFELRLPRLILATISGAGLATAGAVLQSLFRNPLVDPLLAGVSAGGAMMTIIVIVFGASGFYFVSLPLLSTASFCGSLLVSIFIYQLSKKNGSSDMYSLLLIGIAINALASAVIGFFTMIADNAELRSFIFWMLGSFSGVSWTQLITMICFIVPALIVIMLFARVLDILTLGERNAIYLGMNVERCKFILLVSVALCAGAVVSICGLIGFVGLIAPHLARHLIGASHRRLLPACVLIGALVTVLADLVARIIILPLELPIGIITALMGIPLFLFLALSRHRLQT